MIGGDASVTARLGLNSSEFHAKLEGAEKGLKRFNSGVGDIAKVFTAGGTITAISRFFGTIIEAARNSENHLDANVQAVRRFGDSLAEIKSSAQDMGISLLGTLNRAGEGFGTLIKGAAAFFTFRSDEFVAAERALESTAKGAAEAAANLAAANKHRKEFESITQQLARLEEKREELSRKQLTDQERLNLLRNEMADAEARMNEFGASALERRQAQLDYATAELAYAQEAAAFAKKEQEARDKQFAAERKAMMDRLDAGQKVALLSQEIRDLESAINGHLLDAANTERLQTQLKERKLELTQAQADAEQQASTVLLFEFESQAAAQRVIEQHKLKQLPIDERLVQLTRQQKDLEEGIRTFVGDHETLKGLIAQHEQLSVSIAQTKIELEERQIQQAREQANVQAQISAEHERRVAAQREYNRLFGQWLQSVFGSRYSAQALSDMTDEALNEIKRRAQQDKLLAPSKDDIISEAGTGMAFLQAKNTIAAVEEEQRIRSAVRGAYSRGGASAVYADERFDPSSVEGLISKYVMTGGDETRRIGDKLDEINDRLRTMFPRYPAPPSG